MLLRLLLLFTLASAYVASQGAPREVRVKFYMLNEQLPHALIVVGKKRYEVSKVQYTNGYGEEETGHKVIVKKHKKALVQRMIEGVMGPSGQSKRVDLNQIVGTTTLSDTELFEMAGKVSSHYHAYYQNCIDWVMAFMEIVLRDPHSKPDNVNYSHAVTFLRDARTKIHAHARANGIGRRASQSQMQSLDVCKQSRGLFGTGGRIKCGQEAQQ